AAVHTGEVEVVGDDLRGLAVHIAARICAEAGPGDVLVSRTVKDLVLGSDVSLAPRGTRRLRGVPGEWPLYLARDEEARPSPAGPPEPTPFGDRVSLIMARKAPRFARSIIRAEQTAARTLARQRPVPR
ncbi:MAG: adenylate/guanylate cyclase domain-containing protein, partial [Solirubrobacteraceae bacterium]